MTLAPKFGDGSYNSTLFADINYKTDVSNLSVGATVAPVTISVNASAATRSISGLYSTTSNWMAPDGSFQINSLDVNNMGSVLKNNIPTNKKYFVRYQLYTANNLGGTASSFIFDEFTVPQITNAIAGQKDTSDDYNSDYNEALAKGNVVASNNEILIKKSLFQIDTDIDNPRTYSIAVKDSGINVSASLPDYYAFGTTLIFEPMANKTRQSAGFGFFVFGAADTGYFIQLKSAQNIGRLGSQFSILKVNGGNLEKLNDSETETKSFVNNEDGKSYKVDVKVKVETSKTTIVAYVNGFQINAVDINTTKKPSLSRTSNIALFANLGSVFFDYIYAMKITEDQYNSYGVESIYSSQLASTAITMAYGEFFVTGIAKVDSNSDVKYIEEFGPVAREIRYVKKRYDTVPAFPKWTYNNLNSNVDILGANLSTFEAEIYIINNAGVATPVDSSTGTKISVIGNNLIKSDQIIYMDESLNKYETQEPITFESSWIQNTNDAKNLSDFIKTQWSRSQNVVDLQVFGNPMISVYDIITINYPINGLNGTQKFIVTNVRQSWNEGLETNITARSIVG